MLKHSEKISLAERKAVSPDVIDKTTTLIKANTLPTWPNKEFEISLMAPPGPTVDKTFDNASVF